MKWSFDLRRGAALSTMLVTLLGGCGQRGPLYLPGTPPSAKTEAKPAVKPSPIPTSGTAAPSQ